jgi:hypothetical protein
MTRRARLAGRIALLGSSFIALLLLILMAVDTLFGPFMMHPWWPRSWILVSLMAIGALHFMWQEKMTFSTLSTSTRLVCRTLISLWLIVLILSALKWPMMHELIFQPEGAAPPGLANVVTRVPETLTLVCKGLAPGESAIPAGPEMHASRPAGAEGTVPPAFHCTWAAGVSPAKVSTGSADGLEKIQENQNRWGTMFAWLLAVVGLLIAFVTSWVYAIAKEAKEQVSAVQGVLDLNAKLLEARTSLARVEIHTKISTLLDELDPEQQHVERIRLRSIRNLVAEGERLLTPMSNAAETATQLRAKVITMKAANAVLDPRFLRFLRNDMAPYLEGLQARLWRAPIGQTVFGQECIVEIEQLWRLFRG